MLEADQVIVPAHLLEAAKSGDARALGDITRLIDGLVIYRHFLPAEPGEVVCTVRDLVELGAIGSLTLHAGIAP